jgi:hypothetical protein
MNRRSATVLIGVLAALAIVVPIAISDSGWKEVSGYRTTEGDRIEFVLRFKGTESVLTEFRGGSVERTSSCVGTTFVESYGDPIHTIRRETATTQECFDLAAGSLLGFGKLRSVTSEPAVAVVVGARQADRLSGFPSNFDWSELTVDKETDLPLRAVYRDGRVIEWHYDTFGSPSETVVELAPPPADADEVYQTMTMAEAAPAARLGREVPNGISDLRFETAFSYGGGLLSESRIYIIWTNDRGSEIQFVSSPGKLPPATPVLEDLGGGAVALNVQETDVHVQIFASDMELLNDAVSALRPEYVTKLH